MEIINSYGSKNIPSFIPVSEDEIKKNLNNPDYKIIVAEKDNTLVGTSILIYGWKRIVLRRLSTIEPYDENVMDKLLDMAEEAARELMKEHDEKSTNLK